MTTVRVEMRELAPPPPGRWWTIANGVRVDERDRERLAQLIYEAVTDERERCAKIVHNHQIAFVSDACGWALDKIKDGLPPDAIR